jgi:uncharacterized cofD-like protein
MTAEVGPPRHRVVAIGGGHGLSRTLAALRRLDDVETTAVVAMADDGGSSGRLRRDLGVVPPGDLRKAMSALVEDPATARWLEHRFGAGELAGHALGNLMLVSLHEVLGGELVDALDRWGALLGARGRVLPSTTDAVMLVAEGADGEVSGQATITRTSGHRRVRLEPATATAEPTAVAAIEQADLVLLGPGSLFTSILPNLLVPGIAKALVGTTARMVLVGNLREQPGETQGLDMAGHLDVLATHLPDRPVDVLVAHDGPPPRGPGRRLVAPPSHPHVRRVHGVDLLDGTDGHAPAALADVVADLLA